MHRMFRLGVLGSAGFLMLVTGCASKFTRERFEMVREGVDTREDVLQILGEPESELQDQWLYDDLDRHYSAVVHFDDTGRVIAKEWIDARTGEWEGSNPNLDPTPPGETRQQRTKRTRIDDD